MSALADLRHLSSQTIEITFEGPAPELASLDGVVCRRVGDNMLRCDVVGSVGPLLTSLAGKPVVTLRSREPSLEEIFLHYYGTARHGTG